MSTVIAINVIYSVAYTMNSVSPLLLVSVSVNGYDMYQQAPPYVMVESVSRVDYGLLYYQKTF